MKDITSKVSREDRESARIDRDRTLNPPESDPGMDDFDWDNEDDVFSSGSSGFGVSDSDSSPWGSSSGGGDRLFSGGGGDPFGGGGPFGGPFGGGFNSPWSGPGGIGQNQKKESKDEGERVWEYTVGVLKGFYSFFGEFVTAMRSMNTVSTMTAGKTSIFTSIIVAISGIILMFFGVSFSLGLNLLVGAMISGGIGVTIFMSSYGKFTEEGGEESYGQPSDFSDGFGSEEDFSFISDEDNDPFGDGFSGEATEEEPYDFSDDMDFEGEEDSASSGSYFSDFEPDFLSEETVEPPADRDAIIENLDVERGMLTRQYLYENITACLESINTQFDKVREIREGSDEFDAWDAVVQKSAKLFKPKGNDVEMPYLLEAKDKLFYVLLVVKRVPWIKNIDAFVSEIVSIYRFDRDTGKINEEIYGTGVTVGDEIFIKINKGENAMVSVKDTYKLIEKEILDHNNYMPVVFGVDKEGDVVWRDLKNIDSLLVTGMPRSGKTWFTLSIIAQMAFFLKPSEFHLYVLDPKDNISDFKFIQIPHLRKFVTEDKAIVDELRRLVKVEGPRRTKIIGDAGFVNIWDFKKKNPDVEMPLIYVVIDEVITLSERMSDDVKEEFQSLLLELVSRLPALGIRIFMIPHVVKDQVLKKSITDIIPCRVSVLGDPDHIEKSVGIKPRDFKEKLMHRGDMAVRLGNTTSFVHAAVLSSSNEANMEFFEFLRKFWTKLEPESVEGSWYEQRKRNSKTALMLSRKDSSSRSDTKQAENNGRNTSTGRSLTDEDVSDLLKGLHVDD